MISWGIRPEATLSPATLSGLAHVSDFDKIKADGADIRFVDNDGTELNYEIEAWDDGTETANIWVKVQQIDQSSNTDFIHLYYIYSIFTI